MSVTHGLWILVKPSWLIRSGCFAQAQPLDGKLGALVPWASRQSLCAGCSVPQIFFPVRERLDSQILIFLVEVFSASSSSRNPVYFCLWKDNSLLSTFPRSALYRCTSRPTYPELLLHKIKYHTWNLAHRKIYYFNYRSWNLKKAFSFALSLCSAGISPIFSMLI